MVYLRLLHFENQYFGHAQLQFLVHVDSKIHILTLCRRMFNPLKGGEISAYTLITLISSLSSFFLLPSFLLLFHPSFLLLSLFSLLLLLSWLSNIFMWYIVYKYKRYTINNVTSILFPHQGQPLLSILYVDFHKDSMHTCVGFSYEFVTTWHMDLCTLFFLIKIYFWRSFPL